MKLQRLAEMTSPPTVYIITEFCGNVKLANKQQIVKVRFWAARSVADYRGVYGAVVS